MGKLILVVPERRITIGLIGEQDYDEAEFIELIEQYDIEIASALDDVEYNFEYEDK